MTSLPKNRNAEPLVAEHSWLGRVLEPEAMDTELEARDYDAMDHREVNRRFVADFQGAAADNPLVGAPPAYEVLDLGTGTAQIPIELCRQDARARVVAVDLAAEMLRLARENVARSGLAGRIVLERTDAKRLPHADARFAAVISNSIVHHVPEPRAVLAEAVRVVAPGGLLFVRDLARPLDDDEVRRLVATYASGANDHQRALFDASLRGLERGRNPRVDRHAGLSAR